MLTQRFYVCRLAAMACCLMLAWAGSAFAQKVTSEFDDTVDFNKFKTFAVREGQMDSASPALNNELTKKRIQTATEREVVPTGRRLRGTRIVREPVTQGNLIVGMRDPSTRMLVWRGIASEEKENPVDISKKLDDMVKKIVEKYPPKKWPAGGVLPAFFAPRR